MANAPSLTLQGLLTCRPLAPAALLQCSPDLARGSDPTNKESICNRGKRENRSRRGVGMRVRRPANTQYLHHHDGVVRLDGPAVVAGVRDEVLLGEQEGPLQEPHVLEAAVRHGLREVDAVGGAPDGGAPGLVPFHDAPRQRVEEGQRLAQRGADHGRGSVRAGPEDVHRLHQPTVRRVPVHPRQRQRLLGRR